MSWDVDIPKLINKALRKLPAKDRNRIIEILREFQIDPWRGDIAKLKNKEDSWRRRVGNYRIFYSTDVKATIVEIKEIQRRASKTY